MRQATCSPDQPLNTDTSVRFERRFAYEFSATLPHPDGRATDSAASMNFAGPGRYSPRTPDGRRPIAHELQRILQPVYLNGGSETVAPVVYSPVGRATQVDTPQKRELISQTSAKQAFTYVKDPAELQARLAPMTAADRRNFVSAFLVEVRARWDDASSLGVLDWLKSVSGAEIEMATKPVWAIADLPHKELQVYGHKLKVDTSGLPGNWLSRQLLIGDVTLDDAGATAVSATNAIMNLRRLNNVLTRALSAELTARVTAAPIADVLALYTVDGDLAVPPTLGSLEAGIPPDSSDAATVIDPGPVSSGLVWLVPRESVCDSKDSSRDLDDGKIKDLALSHWFMRIGGLNEVELLAHPKQLNFAAWSSKNWLAANDTEPTSLARTAAANEAWNRWSAQLDNLEVRRVTPATGLSEAVLVAPKHAETLITGILSEAIMRHRTGGKLLHLPGALPAGSAPHLTPGLAYLRCSAGEENFKLMLASAAVAASRTRAPRYGELQGMIAAELAIGIVSFILSRLGELSDPPQQSMPASERDRITAEELAFSASLWNLIGGWLLKGASRLELLGEFMETASPTLWSGWTESRASTSKYNVLRAFYQLF